MWISSIFVYKMKCGFRLRQEYTAIIAVNRTREGIAKVKLRGEYGLN